MNRRRTTGAEGAEKSGFDLDVGFRVARNP
jgi:hypothetical protein